MTVSHATASDIIERNMFVHPEPHRSQALYGDATAISAFAQWPQTTMALQSPSFAVSADFPGPSPTQEAQVCMFLPGSRLSCAFLVSPADNAFANESRTSVSNTVYVQSAPSVAPALITNSGASSSTDVGRNLVAYRFPSQSQADGPQALRPDASTVTPQTLSVYASDPASSPPKPAPGYVFPDPVSFDTGKSAPDARRVLTDRRNSQRLFKLGARISPMHKHKTRCDGGKARHVCTKCTASFTRGHDLRRHLALHSGDAARAFRCHMCSRAFPRKDALKRHLETRGYHSDTSRQSARPSRLSTSSAASSPQLTRPAMQGYLSLPPMPNPTPAYHDNAPVPPAALSLPGTISGHITIDNIQLARLPVTADILHRC